jgi:secreted PhoX family phosphatase
MTMKLFARTRGASLLIGGVAALAGAEASAQSAATQPSVGKPAGTQNVTAEPPMVRCDTAATMSQGWSVTPIFTVGETIGPYQPVGILDGIHAFPVGNSTANVYVNHELGSSVGSTYTLANGTELRGARVSFFRVRRTVNGQGVPFVSVRRAGPAYDTVYDRAGQLVTSAAQVNETGAALNGFDRLCSSNGVAAGTWGFVDSIYFCGEETGKPTHPHGGTQWALDVASKTLWAAPALGRGAWENAAPLDTGDPDTIAIELGDDTEGSPLYLYVGEKNAIGDGSFLDRNGLAVGHLYAWKADNGDLTPQQFHGAGSFRTGSWVELTVRDPASAGLPGYDGQGYLDIDKLQAQADSLGCFSFSRPEDSAANPLDPTQFAFASTGRGQLYPADNWGDVYVVDVDFGNLTADVVIAHDADGLAVPDTGIRSPDNVEWAGNGKLYVNEDRSTNPASLFGAVTGVEASVWQLDPVTQQYRRIGEIDRGAVVPAGTTDSGGGDLGNWETSGILDVTSLFETLPGERLLITDVQAHGIKDGVIGGSSQLVEGGQLLFLSKVGN